MLIVQWNNARHFGGTELVRFQAVLFEGSNEILFLYSDTTAEGPYTNGASATVGIRDVNGHLNGENLQWSYNSAVIDEGRAILFTPGAPGVIPEPATLSLFGLAGLGLAAWRRRRRSA